MTYRLIVLDLDDTLLQEDLTISPRTKQSLLDAQAKGVRVVLASGRPTGAIWRYAHELQLTAHDGWIISFNGAVVTSCATGELFFEQSLSQSEIHEIYDLAQSQGAGILSYVNDEIVTPQANEWTAVEHTLTGMPVREVPDFKAVIPATAVKAIVVQEPSFLRKVAEALRPQVIDRWNMVISKPFFLEFTQKGIDKRHSLDLLARHLGLQATEIMAIGDSYNDVGMMEYAGLGVCMANGPLDVQAKANHITASNQEDGVALAVEQFVLNA